MEFERRNYTAVKLYKRLGSQTGNGDTQGRSVLKVQIMNRIYYTKPSITQKEIEYATDAATHGWGVRCYEYISKFELLFKEHLNVKHAIATSSCTGALHMGLAALGIGPGDEVIIGDINWIATAAPITYLGAKPVLVDVKEDSWCIDPYKAENAITKKTKAIIAVHLYGNLCDMDELIKLGEKYNIPIIEDAAEAIGSVYKGKRAGSMGIFGTFSFHGTKTVTTGEGGMFVTNDEKLYDKVLTLSNHGRDRNQTKQFWPDMVGFKYKMSNIQAAIGCAQMERIDELISKKRQIFKWYEEKLKGLPIKMNPEPEDCRNGYWMVTIIVDKEIKFDRELLLQEFKNNNIDGRVFFWPLSLIRENDDRFIKAGENRVSYSLYNRSVNLPCYHDITKEDIERVTNCIIEILNK
jgi:perosamine synthetase